MEYNEIIIKRISDLCKLRGITWNKLATMSGVHQSTIDNIIRGVVKNPRTATLHRIALGFGMTLTEFLDFKELNEYSFDEDEDDDE
ncbi:MAG: helix-turn-helix transcriptional regulator [Clostridiales bacterium]|nr:helix-turn-helix transcriptional regulator [Clostridiales bacterium]